ncbi:ribonuclease III [Candidatus Shapirobacteria bacterium CG03_land_8_20_14_0_80_39_12]|uniref:Ribonuclease 3 n=1 Tax=Candidatus Shapirobacteria bacterium CG03_land_8_20_14_0_80_39_12 TaxID=1974879 RepID=A0A2M7BBI4_9BACT|nr:MAG: ribonuclease III [Candidatus Shapirobacteria bacterium CG03_land_8_20_14_0_80_39_12]
MLTPIEIEDFEKKTGVIFKNKELLFQTLTHRSYLNEAKIKGLSSNERLEFLGDAILAFWVSQQIYKKFPDFPEGQLTFVRTHLVRTETLTGLARILDLGKFLKMSKGEEQSGGRENPVLLANTFEALIGAIFLDQGINQVADFLEKEFTSLIGEITSTECLKDHKSLLQELIQAKGHFSPVYKLIESSGPDHQRTFTMGVFLENKLLAQGQSRSKQEAEEEAAKKALEILLKID